MPFGLYSAGVWRAEANVLHSGSEESTAVKNRAGEDVKFVQQT